MTTTSKAKTAFMPLGLKLACPVVFIVVVAALGAYFGLVSQARSRLIQAKLSAADMAVQLTALSVAPAVVFSDEAEMKRAVDDLARNPDVVDVELRSAGDASLAATSDPLAAFHRNGKRAKKLPRSNRRHRVVVERAIELVEPVVDRLAQRRQGFLRLVLDGQHTGFVVDGGRQHLP